MTKISLVGKNHNPETDCDLFLNEAPPQPIVETDISMAHLLARVGKFSSVGEAKRNGWDKPIPFGWNHITIGKAANRWDIFIWNPTSRE